MPKAVIEGPPKRNVDIILRQTSFKALNEHIAFPYDAGGGVYETRGDSWTISRISALSGATET